MSEALMRVVHGGRAKNVPFPFCYSDLPSGYDYTGGLTLTQLIALWWSLEDVTVQASGSYEDPTLFASELNSLLFTAPDDLALPGSGVGTCSSFIFYVLGSPQFSTRQPIDRVCTSNNHTASFTYSDVDSFGNPRNVLYNFAVGIDPDDATKFALFYQVNINSISPSGSGSYIINPALAATFITGTPEFTAINGLTGIGIDYALNLVGGGVSSSSVWVTGGLSFSVQTTIGFFTYPAP